MLLAVQRVGRDTVRLGVIDRPLDLAPEIASVTQTRLSLHLAPRSATFAPRQFGAEAYRLHQAGI